MSDELKGMRTSFANLRDCAGPVQIPLIQRDYAQGRDTKKALTVRTEFLRAIRESVDGTRPPLSLDFIWGDNRNGELSPLDGQQRLTTLFLLHWYLYSARLCHDASSQRWSSFRYATRPGAETFCLRLAENKPSSGEWGSGTTPPVTLAGWVRDQRWFQYVWNYDPTVVSMLVMLDAIDDEFASVDAQTAWDRLTDLDNPAVSFDVLPLPEVGDGDHLYIKMNSRGRELTGYENFKARFESRLGADEAARIATKLDTSWADIMWQFRDPDTNLFDSAYLAYFEFLIDICEWRSGGQPKADSVEKRLETLLAAEPAHLSFIEAALDAWLDGDGEAVASGDYFASLFRPGDAQAVEDLRPTIFGPQSFSGVDLLRYCCEVYGSDVDRLGRARAFPLGLSILLFAVLILRISKREDREESLLRLRVVRNLVEATDLRAENMPTLLTRTEELMRDESLAEALQSWKDGQRGFSPAQVDDERRKLDVRGLAVEVRDAVNLWEDSPVIRGSLAAFDLDANVFGRARAFVQVLAPDADLGLLIQALAATGEYQRRSWVGSYLMGSTTSLPAWRELLTARAYVPKGETELPRELGFGRTWEKLLDALSVDLDDVTGNLTRVRDEFLDERRRIGLYDWRYLIAAEAERTPSGTGLFITSTAGRLGYMICSLTKSVLRSKYEDLYLSAIRKASGLTAAQVRPPIFTGYESNARWLEFWDSSRRVRSVEDGLVIGIEPSERSTLQEGLGWELEEHSDGLLWRVPQNADGVDQVDRVVEGGRILQALATPLHPLLQGLVPDAARAGILERLGGLFAVLRRELESRGWLVPDTRTWHNASMWTSDTAVRATMGFRLTNSHSANLTYAWEAGPGVDFRSNVWRGTTHLETRTDVSGVGWNNTDEALIEALLNEVERVRNL